MHSAETQPLKSKDVLAESNRNRSLKEKITYLRENITIEPILACFVVPGVLARLATQNLNLDKACRVNLQYGDVICDALIAKESDSYQKEELAIQKLIAGLEIWRNVMYTSIPSLLILFLGAWSDRTGKRKICILMPIIGDLLMCMSNILNVYFFHEIPVQVTMFMDTFFPAITGGWIATYMGAFSYISDISSEETRTFRVGIANLCLTAGTPIGTALSGVILKYCGYYGAFGISASLYTFSLFYGFIYIKDPVRLRNVRDDSSERKGVLNFLRTFFDPKHVKEALAIPLKKGPNNRRTKCILVFVGLLFTYGPSHGENNVKYMFVRYRFNWDAVKFSLYKTFYIGTHFVGTIISLGLFSRRLKCHDSVLGLISNISHIFGSLAIGMARNTSEMYIGALFETFNATPFTALRSISSKLVASDELGKMTSLFNLFEILTSTVVAPLYSWLYMLTLSVNAGAVFLLSAALTIPSVAVFLWFYVDSKKKPREQIYHDAANTVKEESTLANSIPINGQYNTID